MTPLRLRMTEDMQVRHFSPRTQYAYLQQVSLFARHFGQSPASLGPEQIRDYQLFLTNRKKMAPSSIAVAISALRFLYQGHPQAGLGPGAVPSLSQAASQASRRRQSRGSPPLPRLCARSQAPRHPDRLLRGRSAGVGSG